MFEKEEKTWKKENRMEDVKKGKREIRKDYGREYGNNESIFYCLF